MSPRPRLFYTHIINKKSRPLRSSPKRERGRSGVRPGRIVINLCLGVYFAYSEDEELGVVDSV